MKRMFSVLAAMIMLTSFALADAPIGSLEWQIRYSSDKKMNGTTVQSIDFDYTNPDAVVIDMYYTYDLKTDRQQTAEFLPGYCYQQLKYAVLYPECYQVTFHYTITELDEECIMTYLITPDHYELVAASGLVLLLIPEK